MQALLDDLMCPLVLLFEPQQASDIFLGHSGGKCSAWRCADEAGELSLEAFRDVLHNAGVVDLDESARERKAVEVIASAEDPKAVDLCVFPEAFISLRSILIA